ncbi:MAG: GNAT family N-acetyltransferase [Ignavibacteriota bacterium]|nr:GNAT family N-acetyltransferase [Ignavibacteriota bacterium]
MEIIKTDIFKSTEWNDFLNANYNLFYDRKFLDYNNVFNKDIKWHHLMFKDKNKIHAILNGNERTDKDGKIYVSCDGVSFGGFIFSEKVKISEMIEILKEFKKYLKENGFVKCILRNPPNLYQSKFNEEYEYAMLLEGFQVNKYAITNIIDLNLFEFEKLKNPKKRSIQKSARNIEVELIDNAVTESSLKEFYDILFNNRELKNVTPTHSLQELVFLKNNLPERIILFSAKIDHKIVGVCTLFLVKKDVVLNFYLAADEEHKKDRVSDYLLYNSIEWSKKNKYRLYDIGTSNIGNVLLQGLFDFKKKFMADGFLRKSYSINL